MFNPKEYCIEGCNEALERTGNLSEHKRRTHERVHSYVCPTCKKYFYLRSNMLTHIVIHDGARQTKQRFLPQNMRNMLGEVEMGVVDDQKVFSHCVCDPCGKVTDTKSKVTCHIGGVHSGKFKCEITGCAKKQPGQSHFRTQEIYSWGWLVLC